MKRMLMVIIWCGCIRGNSNSAFDNITPHRVNNYLRNFFVDSYSVGQELCTFRTMKLLSAFVPFFLTGRHLDKKIHSYFYDATNHANKHQPPQWLQRFVDYEIMEIPAWVCRFFSIAHRNPNERRAMQIFTTGLLWSLFAKLTIKQTVKKMRLEAGLRPLHPGFSRDWKYYHGTPSGHSILIAFTATYLGLYKGKRYGIPLGLYTGFVMGMRVAGNHHYLSQVFTGAGIGILFGVSSYAVLKEEPFFKDFTTSIVSDGPQRVGISLSYDF